MSVMRILLPSFLILSLMLPSVSWAAKKSLDLSNLPPELKTELIQRYPFVQTDKLSLAQVDDVIRFLQLRPQYMRVFVLDDPNSNSYKLEFDLTRTVGDITVEGAKNMSRFEMDTSFGVRTGDSFDQQELIEQGERLRQAYREKGFLNAVVDIEMPPGKDPNTVDVTVKVTENKQTVIGAILIQSPNGELNKALWGRVKGYVDEAYRDKELSEIHQRLKAYLTKNQYIRADVVGPTLEFNSDESTVQLTYRIERVDRFNVDFAGNTIRRGRIEDALDLDNFSSASPAIGNELAQRVKNMYIADGYARVEVEAEEVQSSKPFERDIRIKIDEGPRIRIDKINISGRFSKKEDYYINFIKEHSSSTVSKGFFNKDDLETGVRNLVLELQNNGYLQAKILSTRTQYNKNKDRVTFYVNMEEGPLTQIESISFEGNKAFSNEELLNVTHLRVGALRLNQIESAVANLKEHYKEQGYIEMMLLNEREDLVQYDDSNTQAKLVFKIFEGPQVRVASIILDGNSFTRDYVILKELEFSQGDLITPSKLDESIARLQRTGFFNTIEIKTLEEKTNVANRTVVVHVTERDPGLFTLGAGATNEHTLTLRGYAGVAYRNLLGTGRGVSLRVEGNYNIADIKYPEHRIVLGYLEPYIFNTRVRGRINITRAQTITDYDLAQVTEVNSTTYSLEKDFTSHILGVWDVWSLATYRDFGADDRYPYPETEQNIATTGPTIDLDFRDNPFVPTKGNFTRINAEYSAPWLGSTETIEYWRSVASFTLYNHIDDWQKQPIVWANQVRGGYLKNLSKDGGVPWDKKGFTLGGRSTVRGYEAGTQDVFPNREDLGTDKYILTTESTMFLIKSELRFPVYNSIGGAVFYDGGSVYIVGLDLNDPYRDSAGFAVRYNTPVGPLSLEFAWKLDRKEGEDPWRFHLAIGTF